MSVFLKRNFVFDPGVEGSVSILRFSIFPLFCSFLTLFVDFFSAWLLSGSPHSDFRFLGVLASMLNHTTSLRQYLFY